jgi:hypothetical protein
MDNIGIFDRSQPLPDGGQLEQADGTAWMAFYCVTMLSMSLELALHRPAYEDIASKFFEHFVAIADAMNTLGGHGLWNDEDGFYYDHLSLHGKAQPIRVRSMVGLVPLLAVEVLEQETIVALKGFRKRMRWFLDHRPDLNDQVSYMPRRTVEGGELRLLAIPSRERLERVLQRMLDETEFLSQHGIRSLSAAHRDTPFEFEIAGRRSSIRYEPGESTDGMWGGNSNWRGPIWFPINYLFIEALERYHHFYRDSLKVECPRGSGNWITLDEVALEIAQRLARIFTRDASGNRPCDGGDDRFRDDPHWRDNVWFHEYFEGDTGRGLGASHQTGWTALVTRCLNIVGRWAQ